MDSSTNRFANAIAAFDAYNTNDPNTEKFEGKIFAKEILYAQRMSERLARFAHDANECVKLAARCQHIGRWEIPRSKYPMDKKGYLQWRSEEKQHHAKIAESILDNCGYGHEEVEQVKFLVLKKELRTHPDTQLLEDVVCLVFIEYYLEEFASHHEEDKVIDIIRKTIKKMSSKALSEVANLSISARVKSLLEDATRNG